MSRLTNLNIGWKLALAFCFIIALGLGGYWNAERAMNSSLRHIRTTQAIISAGILHTHDASLNAHDTAANTVQYVYGGNPTDREHKWETNGYATQAFADLRASLAALPHNAALVSLAKAADRQEEGICNPMEDRAIRLAEGGRRKDAEDILNGPYIGERDKMELMLADLAAQLGQYQKASEGAQMRAARRAIVFGWIVQGLILLVSVAIATAVSRHTSSTLTKLEQTRTQLQENRQHLINAQRIAQVGNWHLDLRTGQAAWSDELYQMLGYAPNEVRASHKTYLGRIHPDDYQAVQQMIRCAQEARQPFNVYHRAVWQDGSVRWLHARGEFLCDAAGEPAAMTGTLQDITERRQADDALRESEARFQRIVANIPSMVYRFVLHLDGSTSFPFVSEGCRDIYGMEPDEFTGNPAYVMTMIHFEDQAHFQASIAESARLLIPWDWEGRIVLPDGEEKWVHGVSRPERLPDGATLWDGILADMTERKRVEQTLARSEERFRSLIGNASDTILILDADSRLRYFSPGMEHQGGHDPDSLSGCSFFDFIHPDDLAHAQTILKQSGDSPSVNITAEVRLRHGDGSYHPVEIILKNLFHEPSIGGIVATCRDITERQVFERELAHQAFHDSLTGLPNRALLLDRLEQALARTRRRGDRLAVLFLDLDNFKVINDSLGHQAGDQFLVAVAERLQTCLRPSDTVARIGGDEFVVLLEEVESEAEAVQVAERIEDALRPPVALPGREVFTAASIGITMSRGERDQPHGLLRDADTAMYQAKNNGKGRYEVFTRDMSALAMERLELEGDLRRAIEQGELRLHYQPIVSLQTSRVDEVEALVRWQHPSRGLIPPDKFIPIAEETGLIVPLGRWVLGEACRQARRWQTQSPSDPPLIISVNLSGRQLQEAECVAEIKQVLDQTGVLPGTLKLEITETIMMRDAEVTADKLQQLRALGVRMAVDDFGTGYSSMASLSRFPIDTLKIDRAFIQKMGEPEGLAIVQAIITLAKSLGLHVTSEGIETQAQREQLYGLGCERGQGFLFARPLTGEALTSRLAADAEQSNYPVIPCPLRELAA